MRNNDVVSLAACNDTGERAAPLPVPASTGPSRMAVAADAALSEFVCPQNSEAERAWREHLGFAHLLSACFLINGDISETE